MKFLVAIVALASSGLVSARAFDSGDGHVEARAEVSVIDPECYIPKNVLKCIKKVAKAEPFNCANDETTCWCTNKADILDSQAFADCICAKCGNSGFLTDVATVAFEAFCTALGA